MIFYVWSHNRTYYITYMLIATYLFTLVNEIEQICYQAFMLTKSLLNLLKIMAWLNQYSDSW